MNSLNSLSDYNLKQQWNISVKHQMWRNLRVVPQFEDVSTDVRQTAGWVFLHNLQVLLSHLPHRWTTAFKQSRIVEIPFCKCNEIIFLYYCIKKCTNMFMNLVFVCVTCTHDTLYSSLLHAALNITQVLDVSIGENGNVYSLPTQIQ